jgi:hypothetical protein
MTVLMLNVACRTELFRLSSRTGLLVVWLSAYCEWEGAENPMSTIWYRRL